MGTFCLSWVGVLSLGRWLKGYRLSFIIIGICVPCNGILLSISSSDGATRPSRKPVYKGNYFVFSCTYIIGYD